MKSRLLPSLVLTLGLAACGPGAIGGDLGADPSTQASALALEGVRNDALRAAQQRTGVSVEVLMLLAQHQGRFELPTASREELDEGDIDETTAEGDEGADPLAEVEAPMPDALEMAEVDDELLAVDPIMDLPPDATDEGLETTLATEVDGTDPEAVDDPANDADALAAGEAHAHEAVYGLMYLTPEQLTRAAALTGRSEDELRTDIAANVEGASALLAAEAEAAGIDPASRDLAAWAPVLTRFVGAVDGPEVTELAIEELTALWKGGFDTTTEDGERLVLVGPEAGLGESSAALVNGRYPSIRQVPAASSNYGSRRGGTVRFVVIHDMEGTVPGTISVFQNPRRQASAHYLVRARDGQVFQMVPERSNAWHSGHGYFNSNSIGIEHEGFADRPRGGGYYTPKMYQASAHLVCAIAKRYRVPVDRRHIFGHGNVPSSQSSRSLCSDAQSVRGACGGRSHHHDPGRYWDWTTYMRLIARCVQDRPASTPAPSNPPSTARTTVKGIIHRGTDSTRRIANATVRLGSTTVRTNSEGVYVIRNVPRGNHTITANASGFLAKSITRAVSGSETWGSMGLSARAATGTARLKGIVYRGRPERRVANATVTLSNGRTTRTNSEGVYQITGLAPGTYAIRASKSGVGSASTSRAVANGNLTWGSVGL